MVLVLGENREHKENDCDSKEDTMRARLSRYRNVFLKEIFDLLS